MKNQHGRRRWREYVVTAVEAAIAVLAMVYAATGAFPVLAVWEVVATVYLVVGGTITAVRGWKGREDPPGRVGFLDTLSWVFPLAASVAGVAATVLVLSTTGVTFAKGFGLPALIASVGIILSWVLLHVGFARVYEAIVSEADGELALPGGGRPAFSDLVYFSITIGTAFATSDVQVISRRLRVVVGAHTIIAFFYNAVIIAVAVRVLQEFVAAV